MTATLSYIYHLLGLAIIVPFVFQNVTTSSYSWCSYPPQKNRNPIGIVIGMALNYKLN